MSGYDPRFWEVSVDPTTLESVLSTHTTIEQLLIAIEEQDETEEKARMRESAVGLIRVLIATRLTARQREAVHLYFQQGLSQQEVAERMGVSQQVVSKHIFGVLRNGRRVGGAISKLKKLCQQAGLDPQKWV